MALKLQKANFYDVVNYNVHLFNKDVYFYIYLFHSLVLFLFKVMHSNQNLYFVLLYTERVGLVTGDTFNEMYFEGCNKMKKVLSHHTDISKLSLSSYKSKGVTASEFLL